MKFSAIGFDYGGVIAGQPCCVFNKGVCDILGITIEEYKTSYFKYNNIDEYSKDFYW